MVVLLLAASMLATACGKREIQLALVSSKHLNLDDRGAPLPVVVRFYHLRNKERLEKADFKSMWKSDQELLQDDLMDRKEVILQPDSRMVFEVLPEEEAAYLAVMALFRAPQGNTWRQIIPLKEDKVRSVELVVRERSIEVSDLK